jgi:hypothetical protein
MRKKRNARRRQKHAGPLCRARLLSGRRRPGRERALARLPLAGEVMRWLFTGKGMLTYSPSIIAASVKVLEESATPDMQCTFAPGSFKGGQIGEFEETPGLSAGAWQMRPLSRGYVEARSNRPGEAPAVDNRLCSTENRAPPPPSESNTTNGWVGDRPARTWPFLISASAATIAAPRDGHFLDDFPSATSIKYLRYSVANATISAFSRASRHPTIYGWPTHKSFPSFARGDLGSPAASPGWSAS